MFFANLLQDLRYGMRTQRKSLGFTLVIILTLGLGIGVNIAIFSLVNGILLHPLPYADPGRLVSVWSEGLPKGALVAFQTRLQGVEAAGYTADTGFNLSGDGQAMRVSGNEVSSNMFTLLGARPLLGRIFRKEDQTPGQDHLVILSYSLWQSKYGGNPGMIGRSIILDDVPREVVGVMPRDFDYPSTTTRLWIPIVVNLSDSNDLWGPFAYQIIGRLQPGISLEAARSEFRTTVPQVVQSFPMRMPTGFGSWAAINPLQQVTTAGIRTALLILLGAVALILLVACVNVANLLLARSSSRQAEMAIRAALGANRGRMIAQLLTESVVLSIFGGIAGVIFAYLTLSLLKALLPANTPRLDDATIDAGVLAFAAGLSLITALVFGPAAALKSSKPNIEQSLRSSTVGSGMSRFRNRLSAVLVVTETALAVILVSGAGLLIRSLWTLDQINTGFTSDHLLTARITPTQEICDKTAQCVDYYRNMLEGIRNLPGVKYAAIADSVPLDGLPVTVMNVQDQPESLTSPYRAWRFRISPDYLATMGIPLLQGRNFNDSDREGSQGVALVSKTLAETIWPHQNAIGKQIKPTWIKDWRTIVGIVDDVRKYKAPPGDWVTSIKGDIYYPSTQGGLGDMTLLVRTSGTDNLGALGREISSLITAMSPTVPVSDLRTMDEVIAKSIESPRSNMWLFAGFAALALLLGVVGIYSVISYSVSQRTREIGVRMALGASKANILKMMLVYGSRLTLFGILLGIAGALALSHLIASLLYGIRPTDPLTFVAVSVVVTLAALIAAYVPSARATKVDPTVALKYE